MAISPIAIDLIDAGLTGRTAAQIGRAFFNMLQPYGAKAIYARTRGRGGGDSTEHIYSRISPLGWEELYEEKYFSASNFLDRELGSRSDPFRWSEVALINDGERRVAQAVRDMGASDGLAIPCHGPGGYSGLVSLAFERIGSLSHAEQLAIATAAMVLHSRMRSCSPPAQPVRAQLSVRERDCLAFIAEGLSDRAIAKRMGVSTTTIVSHVQNARRKLGARTRAQAVALHLGGHFRV